MLEEQTLGPQTQEQQVEESETWEQSTLQPPTQMQPADEQSTVEQHAQEQPIDEQSTDEQQAQGQPTDEQQALEQKALEGIPWEDEISKAFVGERDFPIEEPKFSLALYEDGATPRTHKKALLFFGGGTLTLFLLFWAGSSFLSALGSIQEAASKTQSQPTANAVDEEFWELKTTQLESQLSEKQRRDAIAQFNADAQQKPQPKATTKPPAVPKKKAPVQSVPMPKVIYRKAPAPKPIMPKPAPQTPKPVAPKPAPRIARRPQPIPQAVYTPPVDPQERWNQLAQANTMGFSDGQQANDFEVIQETEVSEMSGAVDAVSTDEPKVYIPAGSQANAVLENPVQFLDGQPVPVMISLEEQLGEIPAGSSISALASESNGVVDIKLLTYLSDQDLTETSAQVTDRKGGYLSAKLKGGRNNSTQLIGDILSVGSGLLSRGTGQSIDFDNSGRISSVSTNTNNDLLDQALSGGVDVLSKQLKGNGNSRSPRYYHLKQGQKVKITVFGGVT